MKINIEFTGMCLLHLRGGIVPTYQGKAYMLGKGHRPRLVVPIRNIANLGSDAPPHMRAIYPHGGPMLAEVDLTGRIVTLDAQGNPAGVDIPLRTILPTKDPKDDEWKDLGYIADLAFLGGTKQKPAVLAKDADDVAAATVVLDRGSLSGVEPKATPLAEAHWELRAPDGTTTKQMLAGAVRLEVDHNQNDFEINLHDRNGQEAGRLLLKPTQADGTGGVPITIFSMCDVRGLSLTQLTDVALYSDLIEGHPVVKPPKLEVPPGRAPIYASGDTGQCPPGALIV